MLSPTLPNISLYRARALRDALASRLRDDLCYFIDGIEEEFDQYLMHIITEPSPWLTSGWRKFITNDVAYQLRADLILDFCRACCLVKVLEYDLSGRGQYNTEREEDFASEPFQSNTAKDILVIR